MNIRYNIELLNKIAGDIFRLFHLGVLITDRNGKELVKRADPEDFCSVLQGMNEQVRCACHQSDIDLIAQCRQTGKACMRVCHMNLCDVAIPIMKDGILAAYVLLGRMRGTSCNNTALEIDPILQSLYDKQPFFTDQEMESLKALLSVFLFSDAIVVEKPNVLSQITAYIKANLSEAPSLGGICKCFFISKNTLYRLFHEEYGCTVGEFISHCRIEEARRRLAETDETVIAIGTSLGFSSCAYFCRFFKSKVGLTPSEYRLHRRNDRIVNSDLQAR